MTTALTILQLNDLHGYVAPHPEMVRSGGDWSFTQLGGLARIATLFDAVRRETGGAVLALDNGDTFHGTHVAVTSRGQALVPMMNALGMDAMTVHWEFAFTPRGVREIAELLDYPILAINCYEKASGDRMFEPWRVVERAGLRIGVVGIASPVVATMPPAFGEGLLFTIGNEELPGAISHLREEEKVDLVVVLSHLGFPQDVKLAYETGGIDVLVSGHTHNRMDDAIVENGAIIFQSGCHGAFVGRLDLTIEDRRITSHQHRLIAIDDTLVEDPAVSAMVDKALAPARSEMSEIVGTTAIALHRYAMLQSSMDDLLLRAIAEAAGTQIAFSNGWRYGAPIEPGPVTVDDLWNIIPVNPPVTTVELKGREIIEMLEDNLERTFAADPFRQMGGYVKRMRGLKLYFKAENPSGRRIDRLFAGERRVMPDDIFKVAFVTAQGVPIKLGRNRTELDIDAITAMKQLLSRVGTLDQSEPQCVFEI